jgi:hypothetical protein
MITNKKILCVSNTYWEEPGEFQVMIEVLSGANNIIWISPFGGISSNLLPRIDRLTESLTIYNPGINFLPLPFLGGFNRSRLLFHTKLYLLEKDFEPDLIMIDSPELLNFAEAYRKVGAKVLYYAPAATNIDISRAEKHKAEEMADYCYKAKKIPEDVNEDQYMDLINARVMEMCKVINN